ncbi:hypothetical protein Tco_1140114, partial [Tanacetum coccineum]
MSSSVVVHQQSVNCFINNYQRLGKKLSNGLAGKRVNLTEKCIKRRNGGIGVKARGGGVMDMVVAEENSHSATSAFPFFQTQSQPEDTPASKLELADPEFYKMGFVRSMRAYGVEFREGPNGFGVYASRDIEPSRRAKVRHFTFILCSCGHGDPVRVDANYKPEHPLDVFPGHHTSWASNFDIINSTNPETDWDLRMACLLLYAFDHDKNFWQLYGDFLPSAEECTSLLLATEDDLKELHDENLASTMRKEKARVMEFWEKNWHSAMPLKVKRLARDPERFIWAVSMAQTRHINYRIRVGSLVQDANMFAPYAEDVLSLSSQISNMREDSFVGTRAVLAAAWTLPSWYRLHRKLFIEKVIQALD